MAIRVRPFRSIVACVTLVAATAVGLAEPVEPPQARTVRRSPSVAPLQGFVENVGQWDPGVSFFAREGAIDATVTPTALVLRPRPDPSTREWPAPIVVRFGATSVDGEGALPTLHHFIQGARPAAHARGFERVVYRAIAPGIDVRVGRRDGAFAYDLHVAPGASLEDLAIELEGVESIDLVSPTVLRMRSAAGIVEQRIGASWQIDPNGAQVTVASRFRVLDAKDGKTRIGFEAPLRDPTREFVLDPSLVFATYIGGPGQDLLKNMDVDASGASTIACRAANGAGTPTTPGSFQPTAAPLSDAWIGKLSANGSTLMWATFLGGNDADEPYGVDVDQDGSVVVFGHTWSGDFPTTPGTVQPLYHGVPKQKCELFITRLAADGSGLIWSTFYGGPGHDLALCSALSPTGDVVFAAEVFHPDPPATPGAFDVTFDPSDRLLARISADGSTLEFQTYFADVGIADIVVDANEDVYFAGAAGPNFPSTPGAFKTSLAPQPGLIIGDAFVAKLIDDGSQLEWATYVGGDEGLEVACGLALDASSAVYIAGLTDSNDFPVTPGAFDTTLSNPGDGFVSKLLPNGSGLVWSTYLGACCGGQSQMYDLAVDAAGNAIAVGISNEQAYPTTADAFQKNNSGSFPSSDALLTKLDAFGETLVYSTWLGGGSGGTAPSLVGLDVAGDPILGLFGNESSIPTTPGAYDSTYGGGTYGDMIVAKFDLALLPWRVLAGAIKGTADAPNLAGKGQLNPGSSGRISVRGAAPNANALLIAGLTSVNLPAFGGWLVPSPDLIVSLSTTPDGGIDIPFVWPSVTPGSQVFVQVWVADPGAAHGASASNALMLVAQ